MGILSDRDIYRLLGDKALVISPLAVSQIQPASVDLRLGKHGKMIRAGSADLSNFDKDSIIWEEVDLEAGITLEPNGFLQTNTLEELRIPKHLNAKIYGKNSLLLVGLNVNTAFINPGFNGQMPLAIKNWTPIPIKLKTGIEICQIEFATLEQSPTRGYREEGNRPSFPADDPIFDMLPNGNRDGNALSNFLREQIDKFSKK